MHCPSVDQLKGELIAAFDEQSVDEISYKAWVSVDRTSLETVVCQTDSDPRPQHSAGDCQTIGGTSWSLE